MFLMFCKTLISVKWDSVSPALSLLKVSCVFKCSVKVSLLTHQPCFTKWNSASPCNAALDYLTMT